ncbi:glycosyltransferase family 4 protein [Primorskyibacter sp. S87]|uniref:glycosyltransferase family 4 protein n=1 Tax=Primorskyibacter sp. S87 TaxID=3415126 RepID=UPI003C7E88F8
MARVAFYAPMKSPNHPVPSGDREMARYLMAAIGAEGDPVSLVSELRLYDKAGDPAVQTGLLEDARTEANRLIAQLPDFDIWVTYHNYYKAPDLLGPAVCKARGRPYVQIESTRASSRLKGPWKGFAKAAHEACDAADVIFYPTANDLITLDRDRFGNQTLVNLPPFLPRDDLPEPSTDTGAMLTVAMMREGDKLASYRIIADTLAELGGDWRLDIAGDGPARSQVEALLSRFGDRVKFLGQLDREDLTAAYARASLFLWPGVNEAYGMVYLEAQAAGVPVAAQDRPGVRDVVCPGHCPDPETGPKGLADCISKILESRQAQSDMARDYVASRHLRPAATHKFWAACRPLTEDRT